MNCSPLPWSLEAHRFCSHVKDADGKILFSTNTDDAELIVKSVNKQAKP